MTTDPYADHKLRLFTRHCRPGRVLDYGCGTGSYSRALAMSGWEVWGVDSNADRLIEAKEQAARERLDSSCQFIEVATSEKRLPFASGFFDSIFASEIIEHVPDMATFISELKRVLRKDGSLYLTTPNGVSYRHITKNLLWQASKRIPVIESWPQYLPGKEGHIFYWDLWTLYRLMHINGFTYLAHDYGEQHDRYRRVSSLLPPLRRLRTGLFLALEHTDPDLHYR
jgi:ubiquinone/menaquinone biosynthesis C-methylase UbiE